MNIQIKPKDGDEQMLQEIYQALKEVENQAVEKVEFVKTRAQKGDMSGGMAQAISTVVTSAQGSVVAFMKVLENIVNLYNKELELVGANGKMLSFKGRMSEKTIMQLADMLLIEDQIVAKSGKRTRKRTTTKKKTTKK